MSEIGIIEVTVRTKRRKCIAVLTLANGQLKIEGTLNIAAESLAMLAEHRIVLPPAPKQESEGPQ